ncbi:BQ5605_C015g07822 [Microbotryum silenes-dioicae]|uniref:BQ5605_C015g07822 protein n=1 Tax=Microbotryum silenes-dioicae TaxID=796604 RepID=A0A2X0MEI6_9BASI|nr:BQ5605_C015g07822 [Microbotryum silenes-dioicae]
MTLGPFAFASRRVSRCLRLSKSLAIFANHFSSVAHDEMVPCLFLDEDQDYYLHDDDFDRLSPLTNMTVAELLAFDVAPADASLHIELSKDEPTQYSNLPYPTLQTRDAFLATDALINARKKGYRSLAVGSTCLPLGADRLWSEYDRAKDVQSWALRAQRWMDKIIVINEIDRNCIAVARRILNGLQWQEQDGLLPLPLLASGTSLVYLLRFLSQQLAYSRLYPGHDWLGEAAVNLSIESVLRAGRVQNPDFETSYGLIPSTVISLVMARPPDSDPHSIFKACFFGPPNQYRNLIELSDCMRNTPTSKSIWFLPLCSDSHWLDIKNEFPHTPKAEQREDSYSCGPATINAVETEVLGIGSFNAARAHMSRLRQLCCLSSLVGAVRALKPDRQAEERYVLETTALRRQTAHYVQSLHKLPPLVDARDTSFSLNWASLIAHRAAHECSHLRAVQLKGRPMESSDTSRGEAGLEISNTEQGRSASMVPSRFEDIAGTARSFRWTGGGQVARALTTNEIQKNAYIEDGRIQEKLPERDKQYGAPALQRYPHFGSLDGAVTAATPLEIGSLICFGLKRGMHSLSCDQTAYGEEALSIGIVRYIYSKVTTNHCNQDPLASLVLLSNVVVQELRLIKKTCYSTHLIDGTMPFRMIDGRQVIESLGPSTTTYRSTTDLTSCYPDERLISTSAHAEQRFAALRSVPGLRDAAGRTSTSRTNATAETRSSTSAERNHFRLAAARPQTLGTRFRGLLSDFWSM